MTDGIKRLAKTIVDVARYSKRMRENPHFAAMREWQEQMRSAMAEAEFEAYMSETTSTAPASETPTPAIPMPAPQSEARQATDAEIEAEIEAVNGETEQSYGYWLSYKEVTKIVRPRLKARGLDTTRDHGQDVADQDKYAAKRRNLGRPSTL